VISHTAKKHGKKTIYNDYLKFNQQVGLALIENKGVTLSDDDVEFILTDHDRFQYPAVIQNEFDGLYFTRDENEWLDKRQRNITALDNQYKQAIAYSAAGQAALAKRPYNLFHRANLSMRTRDVERSFGNKTTWETPFETHFKAAVEEYNNAVFDNGKENAAYCEDVMEWEPPETELVYLDPPYYDATKSNSSTNYQKYYHFLEGYMEYDSWSEQINRSVKTKHLQHTPSPWTNKDRVHNAYETVFEKYADRIIAVSHNTAATPSTEELSIMLRQHKDTVNVYEKTHQYALSTSTDSANEILIIASN
jgi:adenine-specific DNA methylase